MDDAKRAENMLRLSMIRHLNESIRLFLLADPVAADDPIRGELGGVQGELRDREEKMVRILNGTSIDEEHPFWDVPRTYEGELLPGPYRLNPSDDNSYRVEYEVPERKNVVVTDCLGGHEMTISENEWNSWPLDFTPQSITKEEQG